MKKLTSLILALALVLAFAVPAFAVAEPATVIADEGWTNATYDSETGIVEDLDTGVQLKLVKGSKKPYPYTIQNAGTNLSVTKLVIPAQVNDIVVTSVASNICGDKTLLKEVIISEGITTTNEGIFKDYAALEKVKLPDTLTTFGRMAFVNCSSLKTITIPAGITSIGKQTFKPSGLESIVFKGNITSIGEDCFRTCDNLKTMVFEANTGAPTLATTGMGTPVGSNALTVYYPATATGFDDPEYQTAAKTWPNGTVFRPLNVPFVTEGDVDTALDNADPKDNAIVSWATITFPDYVAGYQYGIVAYEGEGDFDATTEGAKLYRALGHKDGIFGVKLIGDLVTDAIRTRTYMFDGTNYTYGD